MHQTILDGCTITVQGTIKAFGMTRLAVFTRCVEAIRGGSLIERVSSTDKEFHFQNWFKVR